MTADDANAGEDDKPEVKKELLGDHGSTASKTDISKSDSSKATGALSNASSTHETLIKTESKEEETIHDSDFEEPSGTFASSYLISP